MSFSHKQPVFDEMEERWATLSGVRLRYLVGGSGPPLILVHGIAASSFSFRLNCADLMRNFRLFVPDLMSIVSAQRKMDMNGSLQGIAKRLAELLDHAGLKHANFLGSSHGGAVLLNLAALARERFEKLVLVSPANPFAGHYKATVGFYLSAPGRIFARLAPFAPARIWDYGIGRMYADPYGMAAGTGAGYARPLRLRGTIPYLLSCLETFNDDLENLREHLATISRIPTLLIWGDRDPVVEIQSGYELQRALAAKMVAMRGVGHLPYEEAPQEFNRIVREYLMGVGEPQLTNYSSNS